MSSLKITLENIQHENRELKNELSELVKKEFHEHTLDQKCKNQTECKIVTCADSEVITKPSGESKQKQQNVSDFYPVGTILPWMNRIMSPSGQFLIRKLEIFCPHLFTV